jgi:hypothetical protein
MFVNKSDKWRKKENNKHKYRANYLKKPIIKYRFVNCLFFNSLENKTNVYYSTYSGNT